MKVQIGLAVKRLATKATSPKVGPIVKLGQFLNLEHIVGEMEWTLLRHLLLELVEHGLPNGLDEVTDNRRVLS